MKIISLANSKGGVCKTTHSWCISNALKNKGFRVLAIDMDPQANLSLTFKVDYRNLYSIYDVMKGSVPIEDAILHTNQTDLIPNNIMASAAERELNMIARAQLLERTLKAVEDQYDYCIIDCPPALSIMTINAFVASDEIIVAMDTDIYSLEGFELLYDTIKEVHESCNPDLKVAGILIGKFDSRVNLRKDIRDLIRLKAESIDSKLFNTVIRVNSTVGSAATTGVSLFEFDPTCNAAQDYNSFVREYLSEVV